MHRDPGPPPPGLVDDLAERPAPWVPVAWWRVVGEHCDLLIAVDRDGLMCDGSDEARDFAQRTGNRQPQALTAYMRQGGPVTVERIEHGPVDDCA